MSNDDGGQSEDDVCDVCQDGDFTDDNLILYCDKCDVAVHQGCYSVMNVPAEEETWFCYPCVKTFDPKSLKCTLCSHKGGAYKCTATETISWVHALCCNWIPELYESANTEPKFGPVVHTERLDAKRMRLKCLLCSDSGAAIQCFSTACHKAVHPSCMIRGDNECTWRVVESQENGQTIYSRQLFCPSHADQVGKALKNESDLVIQISLNAKFEVGSDYFPVAKLEYRDFPFGFKIGRSAGYTGSSSSSSRSAALQAAQAGQKRKLSGAHGDQPPPTGSNGIPRGVPSKRPRTNIVSAASKPVTGLTSPLTLNRKKGTTARGPLGFMKGSSESDGQHSSLSFNDLVDSFVGADSSRARWAEPADDFASSDDNSEDEKEPLSVTSKVSAFRSTPQQPIAAPPSPSPMSVTTPLDSQVEPARKLYSDVPSGSLPPTGRKSNPVGNNTTAASKRTSASSLGHAESPEDTPTRVTRLAARLSPDAPQLMALPMGGDWQTHNRKVTTDIQQSGSGSSRKVKSTPRLVPNAVAPAPTSAPKPGRAASSTSSVGSARSKTSGNGVDLSALLGQLMATLQQSLDAGTLPPSAVQGQASALFRTLSGAVPVQSVGVGSGSGSSAGAWFREQSAPPAVRYRVGGSSLEAAQWSALQRAGWVCLSSIPSSPRREDAITVDNVRSRSSSGSDEDADAEAALPQSNSQAEMHYTEREEVYITPGTVDGSAETFATHFHKGHYLESVHYIGSVSLMRAHLAQNPVLTQPWTLTWRELQIYHAWRVVLQSAAYRHLSSLSATEGLPVKCIFLSQGPLVALSGQSSVQASQSDAEQVDDQDSEHFVGQWRKQNGVVDAGDVDELRLNKLREGVHRFTSWRGLQYYIHRYPYLLQNDSTLTNTLLCYGWQHRVRIKHEPNSAYFNTIHPNGSSSSRAGTGIVNNSLFLWETSTPTENTDWIYEEEDMGLMDETESSTGVWLSLQDLRQRLWVEPARLFQPYDRTLKALTTVHLPPSVDASNSSNSHNNNEDQDRRSPVADPAEVDAMRDALARLHAELAQVKQRCQMQEQRAARLADEMHRKEQHRKEKKQKRKEEKRGKT